MRPAQAEQKNEIPSLKPKTQEVLDEGIDISRDRRTEERIGTGGDPYPYSAFGLR